jgi:uncharacterized membrane protein
MAGVSSVERLSVEGRRESGANGKPRLNVGGAERLASLAGGGLLALFGLSRGTTKGLLLASIGSALAYRGATGHCQVYQALGLNSTPRGRQTAIRSGQGVKLEESITIMRSPDELYAFWRQLSNLPSVMRHLVSVEEREQNRSHWVARGPAGNVEWDAEILVDRPNEMISWRSCENSTVATAGSVHFQPAPGNRGTEIRVVLSYDPPGGKVGAAIAWLTASDPKAEIREDLRNFKRVMETGSLPTAEGQPRGQCC